MTAKRTLARTHRIATPRTRCDAPAASAPVLGRLGVSSVAAPACQPCHPTQALKSPALPLTAARPRVAPPQVTEALLSSKLAEHVERIDTDMALEYQARR